jgi:hypothetical protein
MSPAFNTTLANWQGVDDEPDPESDNLFSSKGAADTYGSYIENPEFLCAWVDNERKILLAIRKNGDVYFGKGVPKQILRILSSKVDKEEDKTLIDSEFASNISYIENPQYAFVFVDKDKRILFASQKNGDFIAGGVNVSKLEEKVNHVDIVTSNKTAFSSSGSAGTIVQLDNIPDIKTDYNIGFNANVVSFGKIEIVQNDEDWKRGKIAIDDTNLYEYKWQDGTVITTPHGLTISDMISVSISVLPQNIGIAAIEINSVDGQIFSKDISWGAGKNNIKANVVSGTLENMSLSYGGLWMDKDIRIFSDSYGDYFPAYLFENDHRNFALDSWSGRTGGEALESLRIGIEYKKPKSILWMLGQNNQENGTGGSDRFKDWKDSVEKVMEICKNNGIVLYLCTIPNTPTRTHTQKNDYVRNSGYPYFDMASILGANEVGSSWYSGLLGSDPHPSYIGAKVIARGLMCFLPAIN